MKSEETEGEIIEYLLFNTIIGKRLLEINASDVYSIYYGINTITLIRNKTRAKLTEVEYKGVIGFLKALKKVLKFTEKSNLPAPSHHSSKL